MIPGSQPRKKRNSSKVNLTISLVFHGLIVGALVYFAAREGLLGKQLKTLAVSIVKKDKPPEKPPEKPKEEPPKIEPPKTITPKIEPPKVAVTPPPTSVATAPAVAPPSDVQSFFQGKTVITESDPVDIYKNSVQGHILANWNRPEGMDDAKYVDEVDLTISPDGELSNPVWKKSSGNKKWDDSVNQAIAAAKSMPTAPPAKFPSHFTVIFDVHADDGGGGIQGFQ